MTVNVCARADEISQQMDANTMARPRQARQHFLIDGADGSSYAMAIGLLGVRSTRDVEFPVAVAEAAGRREPLCARCHTSSRKFLPRPGPANEWRLVMQAPSNLTIR